jgi:uncharacterized protein (DUF488 family)
MNRLFTIGAYGYDAETFFAALQGAEVDLFLDLRRRRGVRGREYAFANANRLQQVLERLGIPYRHLIELAPEQTTRDLQSQVDAASGLPRRQRTRLSEAFVADYVARTIEPFDWDGLVRELGDFQRLVLFCVERTPEACHRSLVAERLASMLGVPVTHLVP